MAISDDSYKEAALWVFVQASEQRCEPSLARIIATPLKLDGP